MSEEPKPAVPEEPTVVVISRLTPSELVAFEAWMAEEGYPSREQAIRGVIVDAIAGGLPLLDVPRME